MSKFWYAIWQKKLTNKFMRISSDAEGWTAALPALWPDVRTSKPLCFGLWGEKLKQLAQMPIESPTSLQHGPVFLIFNPHVPSLLCPLLTSRHESWELWPTPKFYFFVNIKTGPTANQFRIVPSSYTLRNLSRISQHCTLSPSCINVHQC
jgi:hypothetical protein